MRAEQRSFDFMQTACLMASKEHFGFQGLELSHIKALMWGLFMEVTWLYCVYHWRPGEAMVENKGSGDFNKESHGFLPTLWGLFLNQN